MKTKPRVTTERLHNIVYKYSHAGQIHANVILERKDMALDLIEERARADAAERVATELTEGLDSLVKIIKSMRGGL